MNAHRIVRHATIPRVNPTLQRIVLFVSTLVLLAVVAFVLMYYVIHPKLRDAPAVQAPTTEEAVARGQYLGRVLGCVACHSPLREGPGEFPRPDRLMAGREFDSRAGFPGVLRAPNLTPHALGAWTDGEILRAIREGISRDDAAIFPAMPYRAFAALPDADALAIVAWLRTLPAIAESPPESELPYSARLRARTVPQPLEESPPLLPPTGAERGEALIRLMGCWRCHATADPARLTGALPLAGGQTIPFGDGTVTVPNLTSHKNGLGSWTDDELTTLFREGKKRDGAALRVMPFSQTAALDPDDLTALIAALRALDPVP